MGGLHLGLRHVLLASWPVEPAAVERRLPDGLSLDVRDGQAWLSVVAFRAVDVRPAGLPVPGMAFAQVNLRTYVSRAGEPGVYFFSLDVPSVATVLGARGLHRLPYYYARVGVAARGRFASERPGDVAHPAPAESVRVTSRRRHPGAAPARLRATGGPTGDRVEVDSGSLAAFLAERYRAYTTDRRGAVGYATIRHEPWPLHPAEGRFEAATLFGASGLGSPGGEPHVLYSPGVDAVVGRIRRN